MITSTVAPQRPLGFLGWAMASAQGGRLLLTSVPSFKKLLTAPAGRRATTSLFSVLVDWAHPLSAWFGTMAHTLRRRQRWTLPIVSPQPGKRSVLLAPMT